MNRQIIYFTLSIIGAIGTWYFNLQAADGFFSQMFATPVSSSLTVDLLVVIVAFYIWMLVEIKRWQMNKWWVLAIIPLTFIVAFACAYPLFLGFRERAMRRTVV